MIDEDIPCEDILAQINAAKSALHGCGKVVLEGHIQAIVSAMELSMEMRTRQSKASPKQLSGFPIWGKSLHRLSSRLAAFFVDTIYLYGYNKHIPPMV